ncbi:MAG: NAD-dependent epimerase/dehydratase family protein [Flavobacteriales bacterium]|tara:strand:+ start:413 stop:1366 length:954 start_codon:yes stop_codon:yes gene_type:complete
MQDKVLVIGSSGQIGSELVAELRSNYGNSNVIASDIVASNQIIMDSGPFEILDVTDSERLYEIVKKHNVTHVYLLAAILSANAEKKPNLSWDLNMKSLFNILDLAKNKFIKKVFWPSSIAVFGPNTEKIKTQQHTITEPNTVYGISKLAGERWCEYYFNKYNVDVVSLRYPGLIGWKSNPGGGTTDYAVHIFHEAIKNKKYISFLTKDTTLPMMYMADAIKATLKIMESDSDKIKIRSSYNISGCSFNPEELANEIKSYIPDFKILYSSDYRQEIADSWPNSLEDSLAKEHWGWQAEYDMPKLVEEMIKNLNAKYDC